MKSRSNSVASANISALKMTGQVASMQRWFLYMALTGHIAYISSTNQANLEPTDKARRSEQLTYTLRKRQEESVASQLTV